MGVAPLDLIMVTVAVVYADDVEVSVDKEQLFEILHPPVNLGSTPDGQTVISSSRDQVEVLLTPRRINVREVSGNIETAPARVAQVLYWFIDRFFSQSPVVSYGINFVSEAQVEDPRGWIAAQLLNTKGLAPLGKLEGSGGVNIILDRSPKRWTVKFDAPQERQRITIDLNSHETVGALPDVATLPREIAQHYGDLNASLIELGLASAE